MKYKIISKSLWKHNNLSFVPVRKKDIQTIRVWRNLQMEILRQENEITEVQQQTYYQEVVLPTFKEDYPKLILFSILRDTKLIGYGGLVHINWEAKTAEISFLLEPSLNIHIRSFTEIFDDFLVFLQSIAFEFIGLEKIYTFAYDIRTYLYPPLEKHGFHCEARLKNHSKIDSELVDVVIHSKFKGEESKSKSQRISILITSLSKKVPLVQSIREMFAEHSIDVSIFGGDSSEESLGKYFVDQFWKMPTLSSLLIEDVLQYCKIYKISLIIPTRDAELEFWSRHKSILKKNNIFVMISSRKAIQNCNDKYKFYSVLKNAGFPIVETVVSLRTKKFDRYVVKSRFGSGSKSTYLDIHYSIVRSVIDKNLDSIIQPFVEGIEYSIDCYRSIKNDFISTVVRTRDLVINGESVVSTIQPEATDIELIVHNAAKLLNISGHCVFQGIKSETSKEFLLLECNPRVGGASSLSMKAGLHSILWFAQESKLIHLEKQVFQPKNQFNKLIRVPKDFYI